MNIQFYEDTTLPENGLSIFLAGPTLRHNVFENSWRKDAVEYLEKLGFNGTVYVPESKTGDYSKINLDDKGYPEWEWARLEEATIILFWIPRDLTTLPGFTTNVEFGFYIASTPYKVVLGYPPKSPKNSYIGQMYSRFNDDGVADTLEDTVKHALNRIDKLRRDLLEAF